MEPTMIAEDQYGNVCKYYANGLSSKERGDDVWLYRSGVPFKIFKGETAHLDAERFIYDLFVEASRS